MGTSNSIPWATYSMCLLACSSPAPSSPVPAGPKPVQTDAPSQSSHVDTPTACAQAPGFRSELITLPPSFAPDMPGGTELLWFAPGMFDAAASGYWSYVFSLDMPDYIVAGPRELEDLLNIYYRGLIAAVGESRNLPIDVSAISAAATPIDESSYRASLTVPDAFGSGDDVALRLHILVDGHCLRATATPVDSPMQAELVRALECLPCGRH